MIFSLDVRRARKGDCLLLHFGSQAEPGVALIDGGPKRVYAPHLRPRLLQIRKARRLADAEPLPLDLLMVSHVDDDHIQGILDLTRELAGAQHAPLALVQSFWHNSFDDIIGNDPKELTAAVTAQFGAASLGGDFPADAGLELHDAAGLDHETVLASLQVLASIEQGHRLRADARKLGFPLNPQFDGKLVLAGPQERKLGSDVVMLVAGPMQAELQKLQDRHDAWLQDQQKKKPAAGASLAAYVDRSVPNLSSIVVLVKCGTKSILLTGDARGDKVLDGLELAGALAPGGTLHVDVLKMPHHGSSNNVDEDFFERITADHYVFSGDGEHGNPEREAMEMLFRARGRAPLAIHLTYPIAEIDEAREQEWVKQQAAEKARAAAGGAKAREDWSADRHGLASFFGQAGLAPGQTIHVVDAEKPHVIDLLDPLGY
jgi:hypothetical protein